MAASQAVVMRSNDTQAADQGYLSTPVQEPLCTLTTAAHQSLVEWGTGHALYQYDTGLLSPLAEPMPTQTTVDGDPLIGTAVTVDDRTLRMLDVKKEVKKGMDFPTSSCSWAPPSGTGRGCWATR